ncbi:MAG: Tic22 family protein [Snowella sp.]|nr:Tic22 family protein [Snowella sp.]
MNSLIRWGTTLGLVGSAVLTTVLGQTLKVLALPTEEVVKILQGVPVFTIADGQGAPLVAVDNNKKITGIFVSQQEAQKFFQQLKKDKPDIASKVSVQPVSLGEVYKLAVTNANKPDSLNFAYVPVPTEINAATQILTAAGQKYQGGVPLYVARGGKEQGYLTIQQNNEQVIPFFFEAKQIQEMVARFKKEKPDLASTVKIEVVPLENVMSTLQQSDDKMLKSIRLIPSEESIRFIQTAIQNQSKQSSAPAPKK